MHLAPLRWTIAALLALASASPTLAGRPRPTAIERYGLGGHVQAIGLRHGFHIETVAVDSPAAEDGLKALDVITEVDGEGIRSLDHLRCLLAEAYIDDGEVRLTILRGGSPGAHPVTGHLKPDDVKPVAGKRRRADDAR